MVENFSSFTTALVVIGVLLAIGIIFEEQFIALEDKFDAWLSQKIREYKNKKNKR